MSSIDQRVVQMEFDNKQFEKNTRTTMSTLEKLKQSLSFKGIEKGFQNIDSAAKKVNLSGLEKGADAVRVKFSAMEVMGVTALANITNSAINAGKRIASALTIDPVKTGFSEYETQINAIQTILANTSSKGTTIDQVNSALDELNHYADMTIYNFTEMTRNIGTFTAAGVGLNTSVQAIKGIANLAAVSGSNAHQASTAMYQLSQALASGTVKLQDWNSVVNAGMGGQVFQDSLKETARVHGIAIDEMIKDEGSFRETLKEGWLTSSVLTETLAKFTGDLNADQLRTIGYSEEQVEAIIKLGDMANGAATNVKTLTQLWDTLKEAAQSGWTQSWQLIVGDFEESKELFTEISDVISNMLNKQSEARNALLKSGLMSQWDQFASTWTSSMGQGIASMDALKEIIKTVATEQGVAVDDLITKNGTFEKSLKEGWLSADIMSESMARMADKMGSMSEDELKAAGYTKEHADAIKALNEEIQNGTTDMADFSKSLTKMSGRENLIQSLRNAFNGLMSVIKPAKAAFREVFPATTGEQLYKITERVKEFTSHLTLSGENADKVGRTFKGLFSIVKVFSDVVGGGLKVGLTVVSRLFGRARGDVLSMSASLGDAAVSFKEFVESNNLVNKGISSISSGLKSGAAMAKKWINSFKELPTVQSGISKLESVFAKGFKRITGSIGGGNVKMEDLKANLQGINLFSFSGISKAFKTFVSIVTDKTKSFEENTDKAKKRVTEFGKELKDSFEEPAKSIDFLKEKILSFATFAKEKLSGINVGSLLAIGIGAGWVMFVRQASKLTKSVTALIGSIKKLTDLAGGPFTKLNDLLGGLGSVLKAYTFQIKAKALMEVAKSIAVLAASIAILSLLDQKKLWSSTAMLVTLGAGLLGFAKIMDLISGSSLGAKVNGTMMLGLAASLLIVSVALKKMEALDPGVALNNLATIGLMMAGVVAVTTKLMKVSPEMTKGSGMLLSFSASLLILVKALKKMEGLDSSNINTTLKVLIVSMGMFALISKASEKASFSSAVQILSISVSLRILAKAIEAISKLDMKKIKSNLSAFVMVLGAFGSVMLLSKLAGKNAKGLGSAAVGMAAALIAIAASLKIISGLDDGDIAKASGAIAGVLAIFGLVVALSKFAGEHAAKAGVMILLMSGAITALSIAMVVLSELDPTGLNRGLKAILAMQVGFGLIVAMTSKIKEAKSTMTLIAVTIGILAVALGALSMIDQKNLMKATVSMAAVMAMFALLVASTSMAKTANVTLIVMAAVVAELAGVLYLLSGLPTKKTIGIAASLSVLLLSLSVSLGILSVVGAAIVPALLGIVALDALIADLAIVIGGFGALVTKFPVLETWIDNGIPILEKLGNGLGRFLGGIQNGYSTAATADLKEVAQNLTDFMAVIGTIDSSSITGAEILAKTVLLLTGSDLINKINSLFGGNSLLAFGDVLTAFGPKIKAFSDSVTGIDSEAVKASAEAARALAIMAQAIPNSGGLAGLLAGNNDLSDFAEMLIPFGRSLKGYSVEVNGLNVESVQASIPAAEAIFKLADIIPNSGGLAGLIAGNNDLSDFAEMLIPFGRSLKQYSTIVRGVIASSVQNSVTAAGYLMDMANVLPNSGGLVNIFTGDNTLEDFGINLANFGYALKAYSNTVTDLNLQGIYDSVAAARALLSLQTGDAGGIQDFVNALSGLSQSATQSFIGEFDANVEKARESVSNLIQAVIDGITNKQSEVEDAFESVNNETDTAIKIFRDKRTDFLEAGGYVVGGLVLGIRNNLPQVRATGAMLGNTLSGALRTNLDVNSPSGETEDVGYYTVAGLIKGVADNLSLVSNSGWILGDAFSEGVRDRLGIHSPALDMWNNVLQYAAGAKEGVKDSANRMASAGVKAASYFSDGAKSVISGGPQNFIDETISKLENVSGWKDTSEEIMNNVASGIDKGSKKTKKATGEAAKSAFDIAKEWIDERKYYNELSLQDELNKWLELQAKYKEGSKERTEIDREVYRVRNEIIKDAFEKEKQYIDDEKFYNRMNLQEELEQWKKYQAEHVEDLEKNADERKEIEKSVYKLQNDINKEALDKDKAILDDRVFYGKASADEQLSYWLNMRKKYMAVYAADSDEIKEINRQVYTAQKNLQKEAYDDAKEWISDRKYYNELSLSEELYVWKKIQDQYEEGSDERKEADKEVYRLEQEMNKAREEYAQNVKDVEADAAQKRIDLEQDYYDKTKEVNDKLKQDIEDLNKAYDDAVKQRADSIYSAYSMFDYARISGDVEGSVLLTNLGSQVDAMKDWETDINSLSDRGIASGLLDELRAMGPSSAAEIKALTTLTDDQLTQYVTLWQQKHELAKNQAVFELESMRIETETKIQELTATANTELEAYKTAWKNQLAEVNADAANKLATLKTEFDTQVGEISRETKRKVRHLIDDIESSFEEHSTAIEGAFEEHGEELVQQTEGMAASIKKAMETPDWVSVGTNIVRGIQKGINDLAQDLAETAARVARDALEAAEEALDINSPSGEFETVGMYCDKGFAKGLLEYAKLVTSGASSVGNQAIDSMKNLGSRISNVINSDMDIQPTIRPVLDLSAVNSEALKLDALFSRNKALTVNAVMNAKTNNSPEIQNGDEALGKSGTFKFVQNNYSPTALSRVDIYRQTKNQFSAFERMVKA